MQLHEAQHEALVKQQSAALKAGGSTWTHKAQREELVKKQGIALDAGRLRMNFFVRTNR